MHRLLVVANQTVVGTHITSYVYELRKSHPEIDVHVIVPATPRRTDQGALADIGDEDASGVGRAGEQLAAAIAALENVGANVKGEVGAEDPMQAVNNVMEHNSFDQILVSTLPLGSSRWIKMDVPHRLRRRYGIEVEHLVGPSIIDWETRPAKRRETARILLVEDNHDDVDLVSAALDRSDLDTVLKVTSHGRRALDYLRDVGQENVDLILLDLKMPLVDGHSFLEQLAAEFDVDAMSIVVLTTSDLLHDRERAYALGVRAYVLKDPDFRVFSDTLHSLVGEFAS
jgi:CheY-like chemotaxis protein